MVLQQTSDTAWANLNSSLGILTLKLDKENQHLFGYQDSKIENSMFLVPCFLSCGQEKQRTRPLSQVYAHQVENETDREKTEREEQIT